MGRPETGRPVCIRIQLTATTACDTVPHSTWIVSQRNEWTKEQSLNVEFLGLCWHFVDIVWIVIFTLVYLVQT